MAALVTSFNSPTDPLAVEIAPETQTAGFFSSLFKGISNFFKKVSEVFHDITCKVLSGNAQGIAGGCGDGGGSGSGAGSGGGDSGGPASQTGETRTGPDTADGSLAGRICTSAPNACGMTANGTTNAQGVCAAGPPPLSSCPVPVFGNFSAQPTLVRKGNSSTLSWQVSSATVCSINGGGLNLLNLALTGTRATNDIENRTEFTLTCFNGDAALGAPSTSSTTVINIVPTYQEQ